MTVVANRSRELRFETQEQSIDQDTWDKCNAIGLNPNDLSLGPHDSPVVKAAVDYTLGLMGSAVERFYEDPEALKLSKMKSDIPYLLGVHVKKANEDADSKPFDKIISSVTNDERRANSLKIKAEIISGTVLFNSKMAIIKAIGDLPSAIEKRDAKSIEDLSKVFKAHGLELGGLPTDKSEPIDERSMAPVRLGTGSTARQNVQRLVIGTVAAGTLLSGVAGPVAAAENSPTPSSSAKQSSVSVAEVNPNGTINSSPNTANSSNSTSSTSVKVSTAGNSKSGNQSPDSSPVAAQIPSTLEVQPNGVVVTVPSSAENQPANTATQSPDVSPGESSSSATPNTGNQSSSLSTISSESAQTPDASPSPSGNPANSESPDASPGSSNTPNVTSPATATEGSNSQQSTSSSGTASQETTTPNPGSQPTVATGFTVPGAGVTYVESQPSTAGAEGQPSDSLAQNQSQGAKITATLTPDNQAPIDRLQKAVATGNLNALATGSSSPFAAMDPAHPGKVLNMPITGAQKAQVTAQADFLNGVLAGNPTVISVVGNYLAENPVPDQSPQSTADNLQGSFVEKGHPDLSLAQKAVLSQLMPTILNPLVTSAKIDTDNAYHAFGIAESIRRHRLQDGNQVGSGSNTGSNAEMQNSPESVRYSLQLPNIVDKQALAAAIDEHIRQKAPNSPMIGMGIYIVEGGIKWGINPVEIAAAADMESQYASDQHSVVVTHNTFNPWNRECPASKPSVTYVDGVSGFHHRACTYLSFKDALMRDDNTGMIAASEGYDSFPQYMHRKFVLHGKTTLPAFLGNFTPVHEQGDARHNLLIRGYMVTMDQIYALAGDAVNFNNVPNNNQNTVNSRAETSGGVFTDNKTVVIPDASVALQEGAILAAKTIQTAKDGGSYLSDAACAPGQPGKGCSNLCDHVSAYLYGHEHSGYYTARTHRVAMQANGLLHRGSDKYEPAVGSYMFWGNSGEGHTAIYAGNGMIYTTDLYNNKYGIVGGVYLAKAVDVTKLWGLTYKGWAYDKKLS